MGRKHKPKIGSFRFSIGTLVVGPPCLATFMFIQPDVGMMAFLTMLMLMAVPISLMIDLLLAAKRDRLTNLQLSLRQLLLVVACLAAYISMFRDPWPFRLRFAVSRSALERLAIQVENGETPGPQRASLFVIKKTGKKEREGKVYTILWTEPGGGSPTGFVHPAPDDRRLIDDWSATHLNDPEWQFFIQD